MYKAFKFISGLISFAFQHKTFFYNTVIKHFKSFTFFVVTIYCSFAFAFAIIFAYRDCEDLIRDRIIGLPGESPPPSFSFFYDSRFDDERWLVGLVGVKLIKISHVL